LLEAKTYCVSLKCHLYVWNINCNTTLYCVLLLDGAEVAAGISVSSSSCYDNSLTCASRAVDGNFSQFNYFKSKEEAGQWLRLNLSQVHHIFRVQVTSHQR